MAKTTLQIPIDSGLRDKATQVATDLGFSSLQEAVRVYLKQLSDRRISFSLAPGEHVEYLTPDQEAVLEKKSAQVDKDIENGDYISSTSTKELMDYLND